MTTPSVHTLDGKQLQLFLEVYECNSVSRAAERLGLTQSTVSHGLERLRRCLDDPLFVRDGRNIAPTSQADFLAPRIRAALTALEALTEPQIYDPSRDTRPLTIAGHPDELQSEMICIYRALSRAAPQMPLRIYNLGPSSNARTLLETGTADLVIMVRRGALPGELLSKPLFKDRKATFFDPTMRAPVTTLEAFSAARHAVLDFGGPDQSLLEQHLDDLPEARKVMLYASDIDTLARLMKGTDLIATMQSRFHKTALAGFACCPPPFEMAEVQYDLVWHRRQTLSRRLIWMRDTISALLADAGARHSACDPLPATTSRQPPTE